MLSGERRRDQETVSECMSIWIYTRKFGKYQSEIKKNYKHKQHMGKCVVAKATGRPNDDDFMFS